MLIPKLILLLKKIIPEYINDKTSSI
jgi:hypothetical protein